MMEYWDLYDYRGKRKNKIAIRGSKLNNDEFHLVVNAWIVNDKGEFLITQRSENKTHPLMWECTGGSALLGESSLQTAIREIKEELGIDVNTKTATFIGESRRFYESCPDILHVWLFRSNEDIKNIKIQEEEVNDVMWASKDKILELFQDNKFEANSFFSKVISSIDCTMPLTNKLDNEEVIIKLISDKIPMMGDENNSFYHDILPVSVIVVVGKNNNVILPASINLIKIEDDKFKYVGEDFIYPQKFNDKINKQIKEYTNTICNELKKNGYRGIIKINYIIDNKDNVYFTKFSNNYESAFIINKYLNKYCHVSLEEINYLATTNNCVGNTYLDKIDYSFIANVNSYPKFKYYKIVKRKYKLFNYSIILHSDFIKRETYK